MGLLGSTSLHHTQLSFQTPNVISKFARLLGYQLGLQGVDIRLQSIDLVKGGEIPLGVVGGRTALCVAIG